MSPPIQYHNALPAEQVARMFHDVYESLAGSYGYATRLDTREFDPSSKNGQLMIATVRRVLTQLGASYIGERIRNARAEYAQIVERHPRLIPTPPGEDVSGLVTQPRPPRPGAARTPREAELIALLDYIFQSVDEGAVEAVLADPEVPVVP